MSPTQTGQILAFVTTVWPSFKMEEGTPHAWAMVLADIRFEDAQEAARQLAAENEFIHVSHIVKRCKKIAVEQMRQGEAIDPPTDLDPDDAAAYLKWVRLRPSEKLERLELAGGPQRELAR